MEMNPDRRIKVILTPVQAEAIVYALDFVSQMTNKMAFISLCTAMGQTPEAGDAMRNEIIARHLPRARSWLLPRERRFSDREPRKKAMSGRPLVYRPVYMDHQAWTSYQLLIATEKYFEADEHKRHHREAYERGNEPAQPAAAPVDYLDPVMQALKRKDASLLPVRFDEQWTWSYGVEAVRLGVLTAEQALADGLPLEQIPLALRPPIAVEAAPTLDPDDPFKAFGAG